MAAQENDHSMQMLSDMMYGMFNQSLFIIQVHGLFVDHFSVHLWTFSYTKGIPDSIAILGLNQFYT